MRCLLFLIPALTWAAPVALDLSGLKPGPVSVTREGDTALVRWLDERSRAWEASFSLEPKRPLIAAIRVDGKTVVQSTHQFASPRIEFDVDAPHWRWARMAVWDVAGNGAFANPTWNERAGRP